MKNGRFASYSSLSLVVQTELNSTKTCPKISCSCVSQGFTFGDFTAEEWEKYFSNSLAQIGNIPPVEVKISLLDLFIIPTSGKLFLFLGLCYTSSRDNIYSRFSFRSFLALVCFLFH